MACDSCATQETSPRDFQNWADKGSDAACGTPATNAFTGYSCLGEMTAGSTVPGRARGFGTDCKHNPLGPPALHMPHCAMPFETSRAAERSAPPQARHDADAGLQ
jgi:hypothetical protein